MTLMACFEKMRANMKLPVEKQHLIPFRESKLTRLFQDSLVNDASSGRVIMIVNACPRVSDFDETLNALKYASLTREVRVLKKPQRKSYRVVVRKSRMRSSVRSTASASIREGEEEEGRRVSKRGNTARDSHANKRRSVDRAVLQELERVKLRVLELEQSLATVQEENLQLVRDALRVLVVLPTSL